jgi:hypothetical protein
MMSIVSFCKAFLMRPDRKRWLSVILAVATVLVYLNALGAGFVWDDEVLVVGNPFIRKLTHIGELVQRDPFLEKADSGRFYRPVQPIVYALQYAIWKLNPVGFHAVNVGLHVASVIAVFGMLIALGIATLPAFLATLWWAIHPLNTEAVTYVSGVGDVLFLLFSILTFRLWHWALHQSQSVRARWGYFGAALTGMIALFSKEAAFALPFMMVAYLGIYGADLLPQKRKWNAWVLVGMIGAYLAFRFGVLHHSTDIGTLSWIAKASLWERILTLSYMAVMSLKLFLIPYPLHMEYHTVIESVWDPYVWAGLPVVAGVAYLIYQHVEKRFFYFWGAWIVLAFGPVSQVFIPMSASFREHWVYLPGIGISVLLVSALWRFFRFPGVALGFLALMVGYGGITVARNQDWKDGFTLYTHDVKYEPRSCLLHNNLGVEQFRRQDIEAAKTSFQNAIYAAPDQRYGTAYNNYGVILEQEGRLQEAAMCYQKGISYSQYVLAYENLGRLFLRLNRPDQAIPVLESGAALYSFSSGIYYYLGVAYLQLNQRDKAVAAFKEVLKQTPSDTRVQQLVDQLEN